MASLASIGFKKTKLIDLMNDTEGEWVNLTASINDQTDNYGNNVSVYVQQSKEERDSGANKNYVANGKVFWTDGKVKIADKKS